MTKKKRRPNDTYYTPGVVAQQIVDRVLPALGVTEPRRILEPSVGQGAFLGPLRRAFPTAQIFGIDVHPFALDDAQRFGAVVETADFLDSEYLEPHDLVIGNPPYKLALEFCRKAILLAPTVVFVLRLSFMASIKRLSFWEQNRPARVWVLSKRPSFSGDGRSDVKTDYCAITWQAGYTGTALHWLPPPGWV